MEKATDWVKATGWKESLPLLFWILLIVLPIIFFFKKDTKVYFKGLSIEFVDSNRTMLKVKDFYENEDKYVFIPDTIIRAKGYLAIQDDNDGKISYNANEFERIWDTDEVFNLCDEYNLCQLKDYIIERNLVGKSLKLKDVPKGITIYERKKK